MAGVWIFRNGVARLVSNPLMQSLDEAGMELGEHKRRKVLVYLPTNEVIQSYADLEPKLMALGWERYPDEDPDMLQYHKSSSIHLISLPLDFRRFRTMHMYDIVVKNRAVFEVRDEIM